MNMLRQILYLGMLLCINPSAIGAPNLANQDLEAVRIKDLGRVHGWRDNALIGYGIVGGLAGTGDAPGNRATRQSLANLLGQFQLNIPAEQLQSRNVAAVMVSANLPPFAREGDSLDVSVTSMGDARSLLGGTLLLTPLRAANGKVFALAQGALQVGGYRYDAQGNLAQKNHPTVGSVPNGGTVEVSLSASADTVTSVTLVLNDPDYTTAERVAKAVNQQFQANIAEARDASGIDVAVPAGSKASLMAFLAKLESIRVVPDYRARVVINERTGVVVAGGDVRISPVSIMHGELKIQVTQSNTASNAPLIVEGASTAVIPISNSRLEAREEAGAVFTSDRIVTVSDLVQALVRMRTHTRDVISILQAIKTAGALRAELIVQ